MNFLERWIVSILPERLAREKLDDYFEAHREILHKRSNTESELRREISNLQYSKRTIHERIKLMHGDEGDDLPYQDLKVDNIRQRNTIIRLDATIANLQSVNRENLKALKLHYKHLESKMTKAEKPRTYKDDLEKAVDASVIKRRKAKKKSRQ